jgi:hypothetical protein
MAIRNFIFPTFFLVGGVILLLTPHGYTIRGTEINIGWLILAVGAISILKSVIVVRMGSRSRPPAPPSSGDTPKEPPP